MSKSKEELIEEKIKNEKEIEILEHQKQRLENRIEYLTKGDRAKRTHRLCEKGGAIESICPETPTSMPTSNGSCSALPNC